MNIFIVEDDISIVEILKKIIFDRDLGNVIDYSLNGRQAIEMIKEFLPDIVLVDLFLPEVDGISLVKELKEIYPNIQFIMISQVGSKDMIAKAYENGIEYYIAKPINSVEIECIMNKVTKNIKIEQKLSDIKSLIQQDVKKTSRSENYEECLKKVLYRIGIIGEAGSDDLMLIVKHIMKNHLKNKDFSLKKACLKYTDNPKTMEQRMRRAANLAIENIASIGLEDFMNEIFMDYSNSLFNFEQIRIEMNYLKKKTKKRGKIDLKKFLYGLVYHCEEANNQHMENNLFS